LGDAVKRGWLVAMSVGAAGVAVCGVAIAHDARSWRDGLKNGDAAFSRAPARARWPADTWLPGDPVGRAVGASRDVELRRAIQLYVAAMRTRRGFDAGETRSRARSAAESALAAVAAEASPPAASQANDLLGVLQALGPRETADELAAASFRAAVRADPSNVDAKRNLELALRRLRATQVRHGPGTGSGAHGTGRRGAGSGTPGKGY
jgi:hypothetical protein